MFAQRFVLCLAGFGTVLALLIAGCGKNSDSNRTPVVDPQNPDNWSAEEKDLAAAKQESVEKLRQLAMAMHEYEARLGVLPTAGYALDPKQAPPAIPWDPISWRVKLLPYMKQDNLYAHIAPPLPIPEFVANHIVPLYTNPLEKNNPTIKTPYRVFVGGGAIFDSHRATRIIDISDGTANTIMIVEALPVDWSKPDELRFDPMAPLPKLGIFPGGFHAAMADGSVRWIPEYTSQTVIKAMITRAGDDYVAMPEYLQPIPNPKPTDPVQPSDYLAPQKVKSIQNLKTIGVAMHDYLAVHQKFPSPGSPKDMKAPMGFHVPHSWRVSVLPYLEQDNLWKLIPNNGQGPLPQMVSDTVLTTYLSPLNKEPFQPVSYYRVFVGNGAAFEWGRGLKVADFHDGLSQTIFAVECREPIKWTSLDDFNYDPKKPLPELGIFDGGFHALFGDGAARWISAGTPEANIRAMISRNGNEPAELPPIVGDKKR